MAKVKTNRSAAKRFKVLGNGNFKRFKANKSHLLNGKTAKRKMGLRQSAMVDETNLDAVKKMLPYA